MLKQLSICLGFIFTLFTPLAFANDHLHNMHAATNPYAIVCLAVFVIAYILVMTEEYTHLRKSKPVILAAGIIWVLVSILASQNGHSELAQISIKSTLVEYAELLLFLIAAMTYVNTIEERNVFAALRSYLLKKKLGFRAIFWVTGWLAFFISPIADNLTTALVMCAVVISVAGSNTKFITLACINIVVAANAGGAFSPFGDITTLMVWSKGKLPFADFFYLFIPSVINFIVPAIFMHFAIDESKPKSTSEIVKMKFGAKRTIFLFALTILTTVLFQNLFSLPPALGMMTGLGYLKIFGYYIKMRDRRLKKHENETFDIFFNIKSVEWDTLLFFYGITLCVGGLSVLGYLEIVSQYLYNTLGADIDPMWSATPANVLIGLLSAIIDNIPVMFAVLTMDPVMSDGQWLLVTLTAGVGGSLLSVGSAAGVALMGQTKGKYSFFGHLKWTPVIALGYIASIAAHLYINQSLFNIFI